jgi:ABC-type transporter Mla subunit MlaD
VTTWSTFKIGAFVLAGVGLIIAGVAAFGLLRSFQRAVRFETYTRGSVGGLAVGSPVKLKGVPVGEVTEITFSWVEYPGGTPPAAVIRFSVDPGALPRPDGAGVATDRLQAMVETQGITGVSSLALDVLAEPSREPPFGHSWTPRYPVVPSAPGQLEQLLASAQAALGKLERLDVERLQASLEGTARSADEAFRQLGRFDVDGLSRELRAAAASAAAAAGQVGALARDARGTLRRARVDELASGANQALGSLQTSTERLNQVLDRVADIDVQGVNATLASARRAARDLNEAMAELRRYPSGFLFGEPPPPATAVEAQR